jgi:hypothetical protein
MTALHFMATLMSGFKNAPDDWNDLSEQIGLALLAAQHNIGEPTDSQDASTIGKVAIEDIAMLRDALDTLEDRR